MARRGRKSKSTAARPPLIPLFVGGFLVMVLIRSSGLIPDTWLEPIRQAEGFLFAVSMVGVGFGVDLGRLGKLGGRPLALGMMTWVLVAGMSYLGVIITR